MPDPNLGDLIREKEDRAPCAVFLTWDHDIGAFAGLEALGFDVGLTDEWEWSGVTPDVVIAIYGQGHTAASYIVSHARTMWPESFIIAASRNRLAWSWRNGVDLHALNQVDAYGSGANLVSLVNGLERLFSSESSVIGYIHVWKWADGVLHENALRSAQGRKRSQLNEEEERVLGEIVDGGFTILQEPLDTLQVDSEIRTLAFGLLQSVNTKLRQWTLARRLDREELLVLSETSFGFTEREIAKDLGISSKRVEKVKLSIRRKLYAETIEQAALIAMWRGYLDRSEISYV